MNDLSGNRLHGRDDPHRHPHSDRDNVAVGMPLPGLWPGPHSAVGSKRWEWFQANPLMFHFLSSFSFAMVVGGLVALNE